MGTDHFSQFDDPLDELLSGAQPRDPGTVKHTPWFEQPCAKCHGEGRVYSNVSGRLLGACFECKGSGKLMFKTPLQARAKARAAYAGKKAATLATFREEHKAELAWLAQAAERQHEKAHKTGQCWNFPIELSEKLAQYGTLTEGQIAAIRKCMARNQERTAHNMAQRQARATDIDVSEIEKAFATARENAAADGDDIRGLRLLLGVFKFAPAKNHSGAIYVYDLETKDAEGRNAYLGKCQDGKFHPSRECIDDQVHEIAHIASDPETAAKQYGQRFKHCSVCGRELTNQESRERGIGPICAERYGWGG